jgi:hypothetical protein
LSGMSRTTMSPADVWKVAWIRSAMAPSSFAWAPN